MANVAPVSRRVLSTAFILACLLGGCKAKEATGNSGFNENPGLMARDASLPFNRTYWNKSYDPKAYAELYVAPVNTQYVKAQNIWESVSTANIDKNQIHKDIDAMAEYTRQSFVRAASDDPKHRFVVVDKPGPKTLVLELAIVQLVPSKPVLNAIGYVTWIPTAVAIGGATATDSQDYGKGVVAIEGRCRDGASGAVIGMFADRENPKTAFIDLKALNWWAPAKAIIDDWSRQVIAVANRPAGGVVKDSPTFDLLVW